MDEFYAQAAAIPRPAAIQARSEGFSREDWGSAARLRSHVASDSDPGATAPGNQPDRHGAGCRDLSARSTACRLAISGTGRGGSALRRAASGAREVVGLAPGISVGCDGLCFASRRLCTLDNPARGRGGEASRDRGEGRSRNGPSSSRKPRAEAVAGKKCGAFRLSTTNTSRRWRTC